MHCPHIVKNREAWDRLEEGEKHLVFWQFDLYGNGFHSALWTALKKADTKNLGLLEMGYPAEVRALKRFRGEDGYWQSIVEKLGVSCYA